MAAWAVRDDLHAGWTPLLILPLRHPPHTALFLAVFFRFVLCLPSQVRAVCSARRGAVC